ncbi:hypothetical protein D3C73_1428130 [compost metagenome]
MARPALWVVPMHSPANVAATQNTGAVTAEYATSTITIHPPKVMASAGLWPMRSCT